MAHPELIKILLLSISAFLFALAATPLLTNFLYKHRLGKQIRNDGSTPLYSQMHAAKEGTPTMGGILVWGTLVIFICTIWVLDRLLHFPGAHFFNFLTRKETLLPLGAFLGASLVGLLDDFLDVRKRGFNGRGLRFRVKIWLYIFVAVIGAWWFYFKLGFTDLHIPFVNQSLHLGWVFIPFFILTVVFISFAVDLTDGLDGLAGGTLMIAFLALGTIAFLQGKTNLAAFIGIIIGSLLAFLWFNVYPARFIMGDTGAMGMGVLLAIVAFLTNSVFLLGLIGFVFILEAVSVLIQLFSKAVFKRKVFLSAPLHHHFEALGWPETKVTMRFWIIAAVTSVFAIIFYFIG
jgi:phospho-N-acetylmuramoyl-pentapeptide-transferase